MKKTLQLAVAAVLAGAAAPAGAATYVIDPVHSTVGFKIRHLATKVHGNFAKVTGTLDYEKGHPETWKTEATVEAASINTGVEKRDGHLKSPDFFDAGKCPVLSFKSTGITDVKGDTAKLHGDLSIHCTTRPVVLDLEIGGETQDKMTGHRFGASATGKINRKDFGLTWNKAIESGGWIVGEDVELMLEVEAVEKPAEAPKAQAKP